jgi:S1-C subfamily serine protease
VGRWCPQAFGCVALTQCQRKPTQTPTPVEGTPALCPSPSRAKISCVVGSKVLSSDPAVERFRQTMDLYDRREYDKAIKEPTKIIRLDPTLVPAYQERAIAWRATLVLLSFWHETTELGGAMKPLIVVLGLLFSIAYPAFGQTIQKEWRDVTGKFSVQAKLDKLSAESITLRANDGRSIVISRAQLSEADRAFLVGLDVLAESDQQLELILPHLDRLYTSPAAVLEILSSLHKQYRRGSVAGLYLSYARAAVGGKVGLAEAKKIADETISRLRLVQKEIPDSQKQTLMSALNNRAVIAIRERKADEAVRYLIDAAAQFEDVPFVVYHNSTLLLEVSAMPQTILGLDRRSRSELVELLARKKPESPGAAIPQRYLYSLAHDPFSSPTVSDKPVADLPVPKKRETELSPIAPGYQLVSSGSGFLISPTMVLTNRHVVQDGKKGFRYRVVNESGFKKGVLASVVKVSSIEEVDLAILELEVAVAQKPLTIRSSSAQLGESFSVLGYPDPERFEPTLTVSHGTVNKLIKDGKNVLHDAVTNGGNSGGPCLDDRGNVLAVLYASYIIEVVDANQRNLAVSNTAVLEFLKGVNGYSQSNELLEKLELPEIVQKVKESVFLIECWASPDAVRQKTSSAVAENNDVSKTRRAYSLLPDLTCLQCSGTGFQACGNCRQGVVQVPKRTQVGFNQVNNQPVYADLFYPEKCPRCNGKGGGPCRACVNGQLPLTTD